MSLAAITATQLTDHSARSKRLCIGGLDFLGYAGSSYTFAIIRESIDLTEEGPGGVSSLRFTINDPQNTATLSTDGFVEFVDITRSLALFAGWIQNMTIRPTAIGRYIDVECIGIEALLDWMLVPNLTVPAGTWMATAIQMLVANATGVGWGLRAFTQPLGSEDYGSQAYPIAGIATGWPTTQYDVVLDGTSLRDACAQVITASDTWAGGSGGAYVTIDFTSGVRLYNGNGPQFILFGGGGGGSNGILTITPSDDMDNFVIWDAAPSSAFAASSLELHLDVAAITRGVYVLGGNAAGSGLISDGSNVPGPVSFINDDTSTTATIRNAIGANYLGGFSQSLRATATFAPLDESSRGSDNYRPGSYLQLHADGQVMNESTLFSIFSIHKTFGATTEDWDLTFGGLPPSVASQTRRLTRTTRS